MKTRNIKIQNITIGNRKPFVLIAGPCVIESEKEAIYHAQAVKKITKRLNIPFIYKSSYDKANRTSIKSFRGPGLKKGLAILKNIKKETGVPVLSDVHSVEEVEEAAGVLDVIQIPAFLCRQTDLILAAARTKKPLNIKKGQFLAPWDVKHIIDKIKAVGNSNIMITERGSSFGYNNLVNDMRALPILRNFGYPVIFDVTHSLQLPGGLGNTSGGQGEFIPTLSKAATAAGLDGLFFEVHRNPKSALSDGSNMLKLDLLEPLLKKLKEIDRIVKK